MVPLLPHGDVAQQVGIGGVGRRVLGRQDVDFSRGTCRRCRLTAQAVQVVRDGRTAHHHGTHLKGSMVCRRQLWCRGGREVPLEGSASLSAGRKEGAGRGGGGGGLAWRTAGTGGAVFFAVFISVDGW